MSFRDEVLKILEDVVAESKGNQSEASRRMGLKQSATLHTWIAGTRICVSDALDTAMTAIGCHIVRGRIQTTSSPVLPQLPLEESTNIVELREELKNKEEELAEAHLRCKVLEELVIKLARGNLRTGQDQSFQADVESSNFA